jgi:hypothetical protein
MIDTAKEEVVVGFEYRNVVGGRAKNGTSRGRASAYREAALDSFAITMTLRQTTGLLSSVYKEINP